MTELNVILGFRCNYTCRHCCTRSGPRNRSFDLTEPERIAIKGVIAKERPRRIHFGGGEPTLYIDSINDICKAHPDLRETRVEIVTNGWFATAEDKIRQTVARFARLTKIHMSYDAFHGSETSSNLVRNLATFCRKNDLQFQLMMAISSPMDLLAAKDLLKDLDEPVNFQTVKKAGRANETGVEFKYEKFNRAVLDKRCPSQGQISFTPRKGFSVCCSTLVFDGGWDAASDFNLNQYRTSTFFTDMTNLTFRELIDKYGVTVDESDASLSDECNLCRHIFSERRKGGA